ncbi:MAG: hypothetical protein HY996_00185 [Micrococcales bacterium]|nr:hypothetical protein [Micrococcales bacterium]
MCAACRITVARESRRFPRMLEMLRAGRIHLSGLRMLCGRLTQDDGDELLEQAAGKTRREIAELLARRDPRPPVPDAIRKLPAAAGPEPTADAAPLFAAAAPAPSVPEAAPEAPRERPPRPAVVAPLSAEAYKVQYTASREQRDKLRAAQELFPTGDLATIIDRALTLLIADVNKKRFAAGRKPRTKAAAVEGPARSRRVPDAIRREVFTPSGGVMHPSRDGGQCTYVGPDGRRCEERGRLELDHRDGFARTWEHRVASSRLLCRAHNGYAADQMYTPSGTPSGGVMHLVMHPSKKWMDAKRCMPRKET